MKLTHAIVAVITTCCPRSQRKAESVVFVSRQDLRTSAKRPFIHEILLDIEALTSWAKLSSHSLIFAGAIPSPSVG